ncbi:(2Fe-2S) ferredoxin domain-containing protein [Cesiribacter andamanensis]|uniref:Ferredoxin n=1 Tax=Cesiribacter andamanensis AMV16 TaxID=1279009 RepID=M7NZ75_9BACT|nr:(2Fe-2S) ferredoxin domain-containing protein [Cesiribacter andamanensis]EMR03659.1 Ferredoxin [Cesiribacter andamanensis AMV16]
MGKKDYSQVQDFVFVCTGDDCKPDSKSLQKAFKDSLERSGFKKSVKIIKTKCTGRCKEAPVAIIKGEWLGELRPSDADRLVRKHFLSTDKQ